VFSAPLLALATALIVNLFSGFVFAVTSANAFAQGPAYHITTACYVLYMLYSFWGVWKYKKGKPRRQYYPYLVVPMLPIAAGIIQIALNIHELLVWPVSAIGLLAIQLYLLSEKINIDHLTGLYNRRYLDDVIRDLLSLNRSGGGSGGGKKFAAIMLDMDHFKQINDQFGHVEGDHAIIIAANLLRRSVRNDDFVARYGGDEFVILLTRCSDSTPARVIRRIRDAARKFNSEHSLPYAIEFSIGYKIYSNFYGLTARHIYAAIDAMMYRDKQNKLSVKNSVSVGTLDI